jgi:hypothetical protein
VLRFAQGMEGPSMIATVLVVQPLLVPKCRLLHQVIWCANVATHHAGC